MLLKLNWGEFKGRTPSQKLCEFIRPGDGRFGDAAMPVWSPALQHPSLILLTGFWDVGLPQPGPASLGRRLRLQFVHLHPWVPIR